MHTESSPSASWDSAQIVASPGASLADLLARHGAVYVKSYGLGSLATLSIGGTTAEQSNVLWNGLPIGSPMLGLNDFALLPAFLTDDISLETGGQSALWGSGAVGGTLQLNNKQPNPGWNLLATASMGSFEWQQQAIKTSYGSPKLLGRTRLLHQSAENDFPYTIRDERKRQMNAALEQWALLQEAYWQPAARHRLALRVWAQGTDREIPPTSVQARSLAHQEDRFLRAGLQWDHPTPGGYWQGRLGFAREHIFYADELTGTAAPSDFANWQAELEHRRPLAGLGQISLGARAQYDQATATGYPEGRSQHRLALLGSWRYQPGRWRLRFDLRQEWIDGRPTPWVPSLMATAFAESAWQLHFKLSRNYRWPTFNQLHWQPGGNADLRPEEGWSQELALHWQRPASKLSLAVYHRLLSDWLMWRPDPEAGYWGAFNVAEVRAYGLEQRFAHTFRLGKSRLELQQGYDYLRSYSEVAVTLPRMAVGEQLIYMPKHQAFLHVAVRSGSWSLRYRHQYTDAVRGNNAELEAFDTAHLLLRYTWRSWSASVQFDNLWGADYRVVERRPMPGRQWRLGLQYHFFHPHENQ